MNPNLQKASKADRRKQIDIMPVSKTDAQIISEIVYALKNINEVSLTNILERWKAIPDQHLFEELRRFNLNFTPTLKAPPTGEEEGETKTPEQWIIIDKDNYFKIRFLISIKKDSIYGESGFRFRLLINEDQNNRLIYSNTIISFPSQQARDTEFGLLKKKMEQLDIVFL